MIETLTLGIGAGAFILGYIVHSNNDNKSSLKKIDTMLEQNKEIIILSSTIEILNRDTQKKQNRIAELYDEAEHQQENINRLLERADYIRKSGELGKLEELAQASKNLKQLKGILSKFQNKNTDIFNKGVLVSLVQKMYEHIHKEELTLAGVESLMIDFGDGSSDGKGGSFGGVSKESSKNKPTKPKGPGV